MLVKNFASALLQYHLPLNPAKIDCLFRKFTYFDYQSEPGREAPDTDAYPSHGEKVGRIHFVFLVQSGAISPTCSPREYIDSLSRIDCRLSQSDQVLSLQQIDSALVESCREGIPVEFLSSALRVPG